MMKRSFNEEMAKIRQEYAHLVLNLDHDLQHEPIADLTEGLEAGWCGMCGEPLKYLVDYGAGGSCPIVFSVPIRYWALRDANDLHDLCRACCNETDGVVVATMLHCKPGPSVRWAVRGA